MRLRPDLGRPQTGPVQAYLALAVPYNAGARDLRRMIAGGAADSSLPNAWEPTHLQQNMLQGCETAQEFRIGNPTE